MAPKSHRYHPYAPYSRPLVPPQPSSKAPGPIRHQTLVASVARYAQNRMSSAVVYSHIPSRSAPASRLVCSCTNYKTRASAINWVLWTPSGRLIIGSRNGEFTLWDGLSFRHELTLEEAHDHSIRSMVWSFEHEDWISGDDGGCIKYWKNNMRVWDHETCQEVNRLTGHGWNATSVDWHPTKSLVASGGKDRVVKLWDARTARELCSFYDHNSWVNSVKWNQNGNWLLTASKDRLIKLYDISGGGDGSIFHWLVGDQTPQVEVPNAHTSNDYNNSVWDLQWHPMGHHKMELLKYSPPPKQNGVVTTKWRVWWSRAAEERERRRVKKKRWGVFFSSILFGRWGSGEMREKKWERE
ncbi:hypothetical protein ACLB2K_012502 [Fragaria x ananassa]